jgi:hypothetical protein
MESGAWELRGAGWAETSPNSCQETIATDVGVRQMWVTVQDCHTMAFRQYSTPNPSPRVSASRLNERFLLCPAEILSHGEP